MFKDKRFILHNINIYYKFIINSYKSIFHNCYWYNFKCPKYILLEKLEYYGIKGVAHELLECYITKHKQFVEINDAKSVTLTLTTGVPSILGPLLFPIYINDIALSNKLFDFIIYADNTSLSTTLEIIFNNNNNMNISLNLNNNLANIIDWLKLNKLSLNLKKYKYIVFHKPKKKINPLLIMIDDTIIERVQVFNILGLTLNEI